MNFEECYDALPSRGKELVKAYILHPSELFRGHIIGYMDALEDCLVISKEADSFWRKETAKMMVDNHYFERYFG